MLVMSITSSSSVGQKPIEYCTLKFLSWIFMNSFYGFFTLPMNREALSEADWNASISGWQNAKVPENEASEFFGMYSISWITGLSNWNLSSLVQPMNMISHPRTPAKSSITILRIRFSSEFAPRSLLETFLNLIAKGAYSPNSIAFWTDTCDISKGYRIIISGHRGMISRLIRTCFPVTMS